MIKKITNNTTAPIGTSAPNQSFGASLLRCKVTLIPGPIQKISPNAITPNNILSHISICILISLYC
ncbi:secreted protein [methanotrophic bacterial endosymbiont of Bathymodiolus sp.]|nr:secreted protein [methanotrophic bacterial endosymbiont of Bathymodiolus sp.]